MDFLILCISRFKIVGGENKKDMQMEVTKRIEFECCYIYNKQVEAHRCKLEVTVEGPQRYYDLGRVITYEELSNYMKDVVPNHSFLYHDEDMKSMMVALAFQQAGCKVTEYPFPISAENLCSHIAESLQTILDSKEPGIRILDLKLREDNNSYVSWKKNVQ